ncbi:MAG TPA: methyl-accepting chemotaxis protein [Pseudolabrys sp.]|nr:methyl-accepting chemotaxis protein [Pseudolabrys sp.]
MNGLIYAVVMESRGVYMSTDMPTSKVYADGILKFNKQIAKVVKDWEKSVRGDDAELFAQFSKRIVQFIDFRRELARLGTEVSPAAGREWGDNDANPSVRKALNEDLDKLTDIYPKRAKRVYSEIDSGIDKTAMWLSLLAGFAVLLAAAGATVISRSVARPIADITNITEAVAGGDAAIAIPFGDRGDEIGALARSTSVFQNAMRSKEELNRTVLNDANLRAQRQQKMSNEIAHFSAEVEATVAELGRISDEMLGASTHLGTAADNASTKTARAEEASSEASANVRDIASAADELSASVNEIDRQVAQSTAIATKAVNEVESTNIAVKELDEAAARIGDVVKLITDIAEQTNLLALNATIEAARHGDHGDRADDPGNRQYQQHHRRRRHRAGRGHSGNCTQRGDCRRADGRDRQGSQSDGRRDPGHALERRCSESGGRRSWQCRQPHPCPGRPVLRAAERLMP